MQHSHFLRLQQRMMDRSNRSYQIHTKCFEQLFLLTLPPPPLLKKKPKPNKNKQTKTQKKTEVAGPWVTEPLKGFPVPHKTGGKL